MPFLIFVSKATRGSTVNWPSKRLYGPSSRVHQLPSQMSFSPQRFGLLFSLMGHHTAYGKDNIMLIRTVEQEEATDLAKHCMPEGGK